METRNLEQLQQRAANKRRMTELQEGLCAERLAQRWSHSDIIIELERTFFLNRKQSTAILNMLTHNIR